jgi:hypothetical protein
LALLKFFSAGLGDETGRTPRKASDREHNGLFATGAGHLKTARLGDVPMLNADNTESKPFMTNEQLASLGGGRVAYVKPIRSEELHRLFPAAPEVQPGLQLFALLGADGTPIIVTDSRDAAVANAMQNELEMVSLH